jgi:hypothetical protein
MQSVPNIVRERLKAATSAADHPDADLLTAFAEQSLPAPERATVLEHLARCADCRDVVALALPATEDIETPATATPSRRGWLTWPALRWGLVAAGVVTIASFGILQYQSRSRPSMMASRRPEVLDFQSRGQASESAPAAPAAKPVGKQDKAAATSALADALSSTSVLVSEPRRTAPASIPPSASVGHALHGAVGGNFGKPLPHGPNPPAQWQQFNNNSNNNNAQQQVSNNRVPVPAVNLPANQLPSARQMPAATQTVEVSGAAPIVDTETASQEARGANESSDLQKEYAEKPVGKAKLPVPAPGQIGGYVLDPSGAVVSNARITITPTTTGQSATAVTNAEGAWLIAGLPTGNYKAQAQAPGFNTTILAFNYDANQPSTYNFKLNVGSASETVEVESAQSAQVQADSANVGGTIINREANQVPLNGRDVTNLIVLSPGIPRWTISSSGALQRSLDQGNTWQNVDVNAAPAASTSLAVVAASRAKQKDQDKKAQKRHPATPIFRAVAASGAEVWAGGSSGVLYHSSDAGSHWIRVQPSASGSVLTGDVVSLEFPDPQHGKITTSTPEVWTTTDSGQTWQKQ